MPALPLDFGARLRAARAYADDISREDFAAKLNTPGASASTLRDFEQGKRLPVTLSADALVTRLAAVSGLPEGFFYGAAAEPAEGEVLEAISRLSERLDQVRVEQASRVAGVLTRLEQVEQTILASLPQKLA